MIPEGPLNKMVPLTEDHGGARGPPLAHRLIYSIVLCTHCLFRENFERKKQIV